MLEEGKIIELQLSGKKLQQDTYDLNLVNQFGSALYENNKTFIKEKIKDNWYAIVDPRSGKLIAGIDPLALYNYTKEKYPNQLFYFAGLIKNYFSASIYDYGQTE